MKMKLESFDPMDAIDQLQALAFGGGSTDGTGCGSDVSYDPTRLHLTPLELTPLDSA